MRKSIQHIIIFILVSMGFVSIFCGVSFAAGNTTLSFSQATPVVGTTFTVNVLINAGQDQILNTDLFIQFDSKKLQAISVVPGSFLAGAAEVTSVKKIDNTNGVIVESFYTGKSNAAAGSGIFAVMTFKALSAGTTTLSFDQKNTLAYGLGIDNAIKNMQSATYTIQTASSPSSVTPTPTGSTQNLLSGQSPTPVPGVPTATVPLPSTTIPGATGLSGVSQNLITTIGDTLTSLFSDNPTPIPTLGFTNDTATCLISDARWISPGRVVVEGTRVLLMVKGTGVCLGKQVTFEVREDDGFKIDSVKVNPLSVTFQNNSVAYATWTAEYQEDIFNLVTFNTNPEYYFRVGIVGQGNPATSTGYELQVVKKIENTISPKQ